MNDKPEKQLSETEPTEPEVSENALKRGLRGAKSTASAAGSVLEDAGDTLKDKRNEYGHYINTAAGITGKVARLAKINPVVSAASLLIPFVPEVIKGTGSSIRHLKQFAEDPKKESKVISNGVKSKFNSVKKWGRNAKQESDRKDQEFRDLDVDAPSDEE